MQALWRVALVTTESSCTILLPIGRQMPFAMLTETLSMSKVWFITGSSRGLGRALTEVVLESGHLVVATARKPELLADLTKTYGDRVRAVKLDVT